MHILPSYNSNSVQIEENWEAEDIEDIERGRREVSVVCISIY